MTSETSTPETDEFERATCCGNESSLEFARKLERERDALRAVIREMIMENLHLADGDVCTLKRLKDAIGFELPPEA